MSKLTKAQKQETVATLASRLQSARAIVFALYRGLTVRELTDVRNSLRSQGIEFTVVKTSLLKRALEQDKLPTPADDVLSQPIAMVVSDTDEITPAKLLAQAAKANGKLAMLAGIMNGTLVDAGELSFLASLPGREELLGRLVGTLSNLPRRLVWSLNFPVASFANVVKQFQSPQGV